MFNSIKYSTPRDERCGPLARPAGQSEREAKPKALRAPCANRPIDNSTPAAVTVSGAGVSVTMQGKYNRDAKTNGLYWIGNDGYLYNDDVWPNALCAYFNITTPSGIAPRMRVTTSENEATGVDNITTSENAVKTIVNGQLVITIDGVQYNAMGVKL